MPGFYLAHYWVGPAVWAVLFILDYALTLASARLYKAHWSQIYVYEGSFELTPYFQREIDALRILSPRFFLVLIAEFLFLLGLGVLVSGEAPELYSILLGAAIMLQLAIHSRHLENLAAYRPARLNEIKGRLEMSRRAILEQSAIHLFSFFGLYLVVWAFTGSWFVLGGVLSTFLTGVKHWRFARKSVAAAPSAA